MVILGKCRPTETVGKLLNLVIVVNIWQVAQNALKIRVSTVQFCPSILPTMDIHIPRKMPPVNC